MSSIELSLAIICCCVPACKQLLDGCLPSVFRSDRFNRTLSLNNYTDATQSYGKEAQLSGSTMTGGSSGHLKSPLQDVELSAFGKHEQETHTAAELHEFSFKEPDKAFLGRPDESRGNENVRVKISEHS